MMTFAEINWRRIHAHATRIVDRSDYINFGDAVHVQADFDHPGPYRKPPEPRTALESMAAAWMVMSARGLDLCPCPSCGTVRNKLGLFNDGRRTGWCDRCEEWTPAPSKED